MLHPQNQERPSGTSFPFKEQIQTAFRQGSGGSGTQILSG